MSSLQPFARVCEDRAFRAFLEEVRDDAYKYLAQATDPTVIYRAQGKVQFVESLLTHLDKAKDLR